MRLYWRLIGWLDGLGHRVCEYYERSRQLDENHRQWGMVGLDAPTAHFDFTNGTVTTNLNYALTGSGVTYTWDLPPRPTDQTGEV